MASALGERSSRALKAISPAAQPPGAALPDAPGLPGLPWLVHWRLRAALSSQQLFTDLFVELSEAAAACFAQARCFQQPSACLQPCWQRTCMQLQAQGDAQLALALTRPHPSAALPSCAQCGHARNAALLRADVADALAAGGQLRRAAALYERQCRVFLREAWHSLAAQTLPKLAACQLEAGGAGLAHTAAALLSLPVPPGGGAPQREAACQLLLQAAAVPGSLAGSRLLPAAAAPDAALDLSPAISAAVARGSASRFFGRTTAGGAPLLLPPAGAAGGARAAAVGDALAIQVAVHSSLPAPLRLTGVKLALGVLQEMTGGLVGAGWVRIARLSSQRGLRQLVVVCLA